MSLPAGSYAIAASGWAFTNVSGNRPGQCQLHAGGFLAAMASTFLALDADSGISNASWAMNGTVTLSAADEVPVICLGPGVFIHAQIVATKVGALR